MFSKKGHKTPRLADWLVSKLIGDEYLEEFFGDLHEIYEDRLTSKSRAYAWCMYWVDALHLLFGFTSFKLFKTQNNTIMLKSMFIIAWRNAIRQKQFTVLNLLGLTIGISISLTIGLYVYNESNFDEFLTEKDRIYRVNQPDIWNEWTEMSSTTGPNVATALRAEIAEFEEVTRILVMGNQFTRYTAESTKAKTFKELRFHLAEENFFKVFDYEFLQGNPATALASPMNLVVTETTAKRYFGTTDAMGKSIEVKDWDGSWKTYVVTAVLADLPSQSHLQFDMLASLTSNQEQMDYHSWKWIWTAFSTYVLVNEGADIDALTAKLQTIPPKYAPPTTERIFNQSYEEFTAGNPWKLELQPVTDIYLGASPSQNAFGPVGNAQVVQIFAAIGVVILLLSCINFINLSTARSANRAKEVGVRKVLGSQRGTLVRQFVFESVLFVAIGTLLALVVVNSALNWFNIVAERELSLIPWLSQPSFLLILLLFVLGLGILSGGYPAFYLSSFKPIAVIKGQLSKGNKGKSFRNALVVFQFTISICLIICSLFVQKQLRYASTIDLGLSEENLLQIHNIEQFGFNSEPIKTALSGLAAVSEIGKSFGIPPNVGSGDRYRSTEPNAPVLQLSNLRVDEDYLDVIDVSFLSGRNFDIERPADKYRVILNEEAIKLLGWNAEDAIGRSIAVASGNEDEFEVIGVVKDFNFQSTKTGILPLILLHHGNDRVWDYGAGLSYYTLRLKPSAVQTSDNLRALINDAEAILKDIDQSIPFEFSFMDQQFEDAFRNEQRMGAVLNFFTLMAMVIACLGLFGLAAYSAEQRTKELSIRKVLGAKTSQLTLLFSTGFIKLVGLSILVSVPLAYWLVNIWLEGFAYRTPIQVGVFALAALISLLIAIFTTGYQSLYVASKNPVDTLKAE
ncbi:ABC transporter permease [Roseivirga pacifica]|uniref:ABC transporter permease n=1 Tax=Roseivirga pacifica TaxID=1267423 RepID=UPI002095B4DB|nr:ABC transporter permease [Roseivirga pacifica]MCO6360661.1 FtsX-like permease family protein [Roseivirga pacifica]MCO6368550.1 FtsX-like permease family protein [Roseivirga pacifica]MCO6372692.1 FtsX-like permease family protein [Roseivirga pacifica]MCO6376750.1 FtsX-like permease family protein [Roseivirga pacifica]MCO6377970.1 FtsX-like permease family protein [Roseivirga pacifica]